MERCDRWRCARCGEEHELLDFEWQCSNCHARLCLKQISEMRPWKEPVGAGQRQVHLYHEIFSREFDHTNPDPLRKIMCGPSTNRYPLKRMMGLNRSTRGPKKEDDQQPNSLDLMRSMHRRPPTG